MARSARQKKLTDALSFIYPTGPGYFGDEVPYGISGNAGSYCVSLWDGNTCLASQTATIGSDSGQAWGTLEVNGGRQSRPRLKTTAGVYGSPTLYVCPGACPSDPPPQPGGGCTSLSSVVVDEEQDSSGRPMQAMTMHQSSFNYIAFQLPNLQFNGPFTDAVPVQLLACGQGTLCLVVRKKVDAAGNEIDASYRVEVHCTHEKFAYSGIEVPLKGHLTADDQCILYACQCRHCRHCTPDGNCVPMPVKVIHQ